jgi:hypothetical protein
MPEISLTARDAESLTGFLRFLEMLVDFREDRIAQHLAEFASTAPPYDIRSLRIELTRFRTLLGDKKPILRPSGWSGNDTGGEPEF